MNNFWNGFIKQARLGHDDPVEIMYATKEEQPRKEEGDVISPREAAIGPLSKFDAQRETADNSPTRGY